MRRLCSGWWSCSGSAARCAAGSPLLIVVVTVAILILTHTRTALVGMVAGILVAGLSLIVAKARVRKFFAAAGVVAVDRDHNAVQRHHYLAGPGPGHAAADRAHRPDQGLGSRFSPFHATSSRMIFGFGLSNDSFNGLPIDSNWLASYQTQGLFGVVVCATILLFLLVTAYFQPRGVQRALALFLVTYCLVASFTEVGFTDASMYLLDLTLAASLLVPSAVGRRPA